MGNLGSQSSIVISVQAPSRKLFNFHQDYLQSSEPQIMAFPSFIRKTDSHHIQYTQRSNFNKRQYEITYQENECGCLCFTKISQKASKIWKNIGPNETIPLYEGSVLKLGETELQIKKICRTYNDLEEWEDNCQTLTDADPRESLNINMLNSRSRYMQNSFGFQSRNMKINESKSSFNIDQPGQFCRYCYGRDSSSSNPLLNLCKCSGSVKYSHYFCLKNWISSRSKTKASDCYEYFEYDLSCEVCKQKIEKTAVNKGKKYILYSESLVHPPFVVLSYKDESTKVKQYVINFDYSPSIRIGKGPRCNIQLNEKRMDYEHCELTFERGQLFLRSLNPTYGCFVQIEDEWTFSPVDNQLQIMINNHLVQIRDQSSSCIFKNTLKLKVKQNQNVVNQIMALL